MHLHAERDGRAAARRRGLPVRPRGRFLATFDNHNSVNGIREFARAKGARTAYVPLEAPDLRVADGLLERYLDEADAGGHNLFAYPAQSNFSGVKHPLEWIAAAQERGWDVIVDCAAFVPTSRLDLSAWKPDFVPISFYKLFGYPTGTRRAARAPRRRSRSSSARGSAAAPSSRRTSRASCYVPLTGHALFEDGTVNYLGIPAIEIGLRHIERIGIDTISRRVEALGSWLLDALLGLRHSDGEPGDARSTGRRRGTAAAGRSRSTSCIPTARVVDERFVDIVAAAHRISIRTGCFCNSGAGETAFSISKDTLIGAEFDDGMILDDYIRQVGMPTGGAVRVSLGARDELRRRLPLHELRDGVPRRHRGARRPAAAARLLATQRQPGVRAQRPRAARPSGRGGSRRGRRASRRRRR